MKHGRKALSCLLSVALTVGMINSTSFASFIESENGAENTIKINAGADETDVSETLSDNSDVLPDAEENAITPGVKIVCTDGECETIDGVEDQNGYVVNSKGVLTKYTGTNPIVEVPEGVKTIGSTAFSGNTNITWVKSMADSVTEISEGAFEGCTKIETINLSNNITDINSRTFSNCTKLENIVIPENVRTIQSEAFSNCGSLKKITLQNSVTFIGDKAFYNCSALSFVSMSDNMEIIGEEAFFGCSFINLSLPDTLKVVGNNTFSGCDEFSELFYYGSDSDWDKIELGEQSFPSDITIYYNYDPYAGFEIDEWGLLTKFNGSSTDIIIPLNVTKIMIGAFQNNTSLKSVIIPGNVKVIEWSAFEGCSSLEKVAISNGVEQILGAAFKDCKKLKSIVIPDSVTSLHMETSIDVWHFLGCTELESVELSNSLTSISSGMFNGCVNLTDVKLPDKLTKIESGAFAGCSKLSRLSLPSTLTTIEDSAFTGCKSLKDLTIPDSVQTIGQSLFENSGLTSFTAPAGIKEIPYNTFGACSDLVDVFLSNNITSIGDYAFNECYSLKSIRLPSNLITIGEGAFGQTPIGTVTIPKSVTSIGKEAFYTCSELSEIKFLGTKAQWDAVTLGNNAIPAGVKIVCSDDEPEPEPINTEGFIIREDGLLTGYEGSGGAIVIPSEVSAINYRAFEGNSNITSVVIPSSVSVVYGGAFHGCTALKSATIGAGVILEDHIFYECKKLKTVVFEEGCTAVGADMFSDCTSLGSVTLPQSLREIRRWSFSGCTSLTDVTFPSRLKNIEFGAFWGCTKIKSLDIPDSVEHIGRDAFSGCSGLVSLVVGNGIKVWGDPDIPTEEGEYITFSRAFNECTALVSVTLREGLESIGEFAFDNCDKLERINIPSSVKSIEKCAFISCDKLKDITLNTGLKTIGEGAFSELASLEKITIPDTVTELDAYAFCEDPKLVNVKLSDNTVTIGHHAFSDCTSLTEIVIPDTVTELGNSAFFGCSKLKSVKLSKNITKILFGTFWECTSLTAIEIPAGVTAVYDAAFYGCSGLKAVSLPESVKLLDTSVFAECSNLSDVKLSSGITELREGVFYHCKALKTVELPKGITLIGCSAFEGSGITEISLPDGLLSIEDNAFAWCDKLKGIVIPDSVTELGSEIFIDDYALETAVVGNGVKNLRAGTFVSCIKMNSITLPAGLESIGNYCFADNWKLMNIEIPENVTSIGDEAFLGTVFRSVILPEKITSIGKATFQSCLLEDVVIPSNVGSVGAYAFAESDLLKSAFIPKSVKVIGSQAFADCPKFKDIYYAGSEEEWGNISIERFAIPAGVTVHFNCANESDGKWEPNFVFDEETGKLSWDNIPDLGIDTATKGYGDYAFYLLDISGENSHFTIGAYSSYEVDRSDPELPRTGGILQPMVFLDPMIVQQALCFGIRPDSRFTITVSGGTSPDDIRYIGASAYAHTFEGGKTLKTIPTPANVKLSDEDILSWEASEGAVGYIIKHERKDGSFVMGFTVNLSDYLIFNSGASQKDYLGCSITVIAIDKAGNMSAPSEPIIYKSDEVKVTGVEFSNLPRKLVYYQYEELDCSYGNVTVNYSDGSVDTLPLEEFILLDDFELSAAGHQTVRLNCYGYEFSFDIDVIPLEVSSVAIAHTPDKTTFYTGENFTAGGGEISVTYNSGRTENFDITDDMVSGYDMSSAGVQTLTVTYSGKTAQYDINVLNTVVTEISVYQLPTKLKYYQDDVLLLTGGKISVVIGGDSYVQHTLTVEMTEDMVTGYDSAKTGKQTLTVNYGGQTTTFEITVMQLKISKITLKQAPTKKNYAVGDKLDITGGKLNVIYNNKRSEEVYITADMVSGFDSSSKGTKTLYVTYSGKKLSFKVNVIDFNVSVNINGQTEYFETVKAAVKAIGKGTGNYIISVTGTVTENSIILPANAASVTLVTSGKGVIKTSSVTSKSPLTLACTLEAINADNVVKVKGIGSTLAIERDLGAMCALSGSKTTRLVIYDDITVSVISMFAAAEAVRGITVAISEKGRISSIGELYGSYVLDKGSLASVTSVIDASIKLVPDEKGTLPKIALSAVKTSFAITSDLQLKDKDVIIHKGKTTLDTSLISFPDTQLEAFVYGKYVRAQQNGSVLLDDKPLPSLDYAISQMNEAKAYTVILKEDADITKLALPSKITSLTIKGDGESRKLTLGKTVSLSAKYPITLENIELIGTKPVSLKGTDITLTNSSLGTVTTSAKLTVNGNVIARGAVSCAELDCTQEGTHFTIASLSVTKSGITSSAKPITLKLVDNNGIVIKLNAGDNKSVVVKKFKGNYTSGALLLDPACGTGTLKLERNKIILDK